MVVASCCEDLGSSERLDLLEEVALVSDQGSAAVWKPNAIPKPTVQNGAFVVPA